MSGPATGTFTAQRQRPLPETPTREASPFTAELRRWEALGAAVFHGEYGQKKVWPADWPYTAIDAACAASRTASQVGPLNLAVRLGPTANGLFLAHLDFDGKCPCGSDLADHEDGVGACRSERCREVRQCACDAYHGVRPEDGLYRALKLLPANVCIIRTARGYHVMLFSVREIPESLITDLGAEVAAYSGRLSIIPPSLHPDGDTYTYIRPPGDDLALVDFDELGLEIVALTRRAAHAAVPRRRRSPATVATQTEFEELMLREGVRPHGRDDEFHGCPWHRELDPSLHVDWRAANFYCFGCGEQGGIRHLRELVGDPPPPSYNPSSDLPVSIGGGLQLGGRAVREERDRLVGGLLELGEADRAERMRLCREATLEAKDADLEAYACPNGDSAPVKARMNSCDDPQCPTCMPWRLGSDWNNHWVNAGSEAPSGLTLARLSATETSISLDDWQYPKRIRDRFREWRRERDIEGGFYGMTLKREGDCWHAELLVAVGDGDGDALTAGRAFEVEPIGQGLDAREVLCVWQHAYLNEAVSWTDVSELAAFRSLIRGRRKFQGFGNSFATQRVEIEENEMEQPVQRPLHRISGGSGKANAKAPCCPRCGERLRRIGLFDRSRMEITTAADGIPEWRWKQRSDP